MKSDGLYLTHISECLDRIDEYVAGGRTEFLTSKLIQDAVLRNLHTPAESTQRISEELRTRHPEVAWRDLAGFRNIIVHNYLGVDLGAIWTIVEESLPKLRTSVEAMNRERESRRGDDPS